MTRLLAIATVAACLPLLAAVPVASADSNITVVAGGGVVNNTGAPDFTPTGPDSQIGVDQINAQLAGGANVTLDTETDPVVAAQAGTITVNVAIGSSSAADLIFDADDLVDLNTAVSLVNSGALLSVTAAGGVDLGAVISGSLSVSADDPITQSGSASVPGNAHFATNVLDGVTLTNPSNDFGSVSTGAVAALSVTDANGLALGNLSSNGAVQLTAGGSVTQIPATSTIISGGADISVGSTNNVTLTNATNDFTAVGFGSADNVSIVDSNLLTLSQSTINGDLTATASGTIGQNAPLTVAGIATLATGASEDIALDNAANDWSTVAVTSADDVSLRDVNALALGAAAVTDDLVLNTGGALTQTGGATVPGQTSATGAPVNLDHSGNDFGGSVAVTSSGANAAAVADANDLTLEGSSGGGAVTAVADDDLTVPAGATIAATGTLRLVADNANPATPAIGTGGIAVGAGAALTGGGAIRMYAARRGDNSIGASATFNGSDFSPGTRFKQSARERWGVYSPDGQAAAPFTFFYKESDPSAPRAKITSPVEGATYERNQVVNAAYTCTDGVGGGTGVTQCEGPVANGSPIDTTTLGEKKFRVRVENGAGNRGSETVTYRVVDTKRPTITIRAPAHGAAYTLGQRVPADYGCADETALASCAGPPKGAAIDTSSVGAKTFSVQASDGSGNTARVIVTYVVVNATGACKVLGNGTNVSDTLVGTSAGDALFGLAGDDRIGGRAGDDCLHGGAGDDRLFGRRGDDRLRGGRGNDRLSGGGGDNTYSGQRGDDKIRARNGTAEVVRCGRGVDIAIVDPRDRAFGCEDLRRAVDGRGREAEQ
jgi:hypothetical protein